MIYFDCAATSMQKPSSVAMAAKLAMETMASPGRGGHKPAMEAGKLAFACREAAAKLFHLEYPEHVVFTFNATHGLNIAIKTLVKPGSTVVISGWEHNAVTRPLKAIQNVKIKVASAPLFQQKKTLEAFQAAITPDVGAVITTHVSNVFGFILPVEEIAQICHQRGVPLIVDASQSAGCLPIDMQRLGAAFIAMPGHKGLMGPQGTGILLCGQLPDTVIEGGTGSESRHQEMPAFLPDRLEAGTHNIPGIAGLLEGIRFVQQWGVSSIFEHESGLIARMGAALKRFPKVTPYVADDPRVQAGVLSFTAGCIDCEELGDMLGQRNIALRAGLHCAPIAHQTAGTLDTGTLRASVSPFNTEAEVDRFITVLGFLLGAT